METLSSGASNSQCLGSGPRSRVSGCPPSPAPAGEHSKATRFRVSPSGDLREDSPELWATALGSRWAEAGASLRPAALQPAPFWPRSAAAFRAPSSQSGPEAGLRPSRTPECEGFKNAASVVLPPAKQPARGPGVRKAGLQAAPRVSARVLPRRTPLSAAEGGGAVGHGQRPSGSRPAGRRVPGIGRRQSALGIQLLYTDGHPHPAGGLAAASSGPGQAVTGRDRPRQASTGRHRPG